MSARAYLHDLVREWYRTQAGASNLEQAEAFALEVGRVVAECVFECAVATCGIRAGYCGTTRTCPCGQWARFVGYRRLWVRDQPGEVEVTRAYYHCRECGQGQCPWDREQGLHQDPLTPGFKAIMAELCGRLVFREANQVLERFPGFALAVSLLEEVTRQVGGRLRAAEDDPVRLLFEEEVLPTAGAFLAQVVGKRAYLCVDAAKAHTHGSWHNVKVATFFPGLPPAEEGVAKPRAVERTWDTVGSARYLALQAAAEPFGQRLYTFARRLGCERAREVVSLGDGAEWIWNLAAKHFSDAICILDFFHASEHVWQIARVAFGEGSPERKAWATARMEQLREAGVPSLLQSLHQLRQRALSAAARVEIVGEVRYFRRNRTRLDYPRYRRDGRMIGSGPVEAACKSVVGSRLKGTGMRWSAEGADAVLAIRTALLGGESARIAQSAHAV